MLYHEGLEHFDAGARALGVKDELACAVGQIDHDGRIVQRAPAQMAEHDTVFRSAFLESNREIGTGREAQRECRESGQDDLHGWALSPSTVTNELGLRGCC